MDFPLSLWDISLWLAVTAIILLVTSELLPPYSGKVGILIRNHRLRIVALATWLLFMFAVFTRIYQIIVS